MVYRAGQCWGAGVQGWAVLGCRAVLRCRDAGQCDSGVLGYRAVCCWAGKCWGAEMQGSAIMGYWDSRQ